MKIKREPAQTAADLLPKESLATANVSLPARLQTLAAATLSQSDESIGRVDFSYLVSRFSVILL